MTPHQHPGMRRETVGGSYSGSIHSPFSALLIQVLMMEVSPGVSDRACPALVALL